MEINLWYDIEMLMWVCETPNKEIVGCGLTSDEAITDFKRKELYGQSNRQISS